MQAVFTNTTPVDAYRGAGRPEATYLLERIIEKAAKETGVDPAELRRRNFIKPDQFPYETPVALVYDSGAYDDTLDKALSLADHAGFPARREESKTNGKLRGMGFSLPIEATGAAPSAIAGQLGARAGLYESAEVRFNPTGSVTVFSGSHSHGQGHATTFAQVVSDQLGRTDREYRGGRGRHGQHPVRHGHLRLALAVGGRQRHRQGLRQDRRQGPQDRGAHPGSVRDDIEFVDGNFQVKGTDKAMNIAEVAFAAYVPHNYPLPTGDPAEDANALEPGLNEQAFFDPLNFNFPNGAYICEVEIDPDTGVVDIVDFVAVDDVGNIINPMIVEGQVHGGIAQGVGQALYEGAVYDNESGQLLSGSLMDYTMPPRRQPADDQDRPHRDACPFNPLGVKGCGEIGTIGATPAVINAIIDALGDYGVTDISMPATPEVVWRAIQEGRQ